MFPLDDTIAAVASPPGGGLRGIIRISGPQTAAVVAQIGRFATPVAEISEPTCVRGQIPLGKSLGDVPLTLYLWPTNRSYTREPSAELHLPGAPPILGEALAAVCQAGARLAQPGEFTLRAFLAGRLDLTQAEAVLGVIESTDRRQLETALAQLAGGLARPLFGLRQRLLDLLAHLEAGLDFAEEDIEFISSRQLAAELADIEDQVARLLVQMGSRGEAGQLPRVVLYGLPNTGKSSLLNALAGESVALVSEIAGTTRDYVARHVRWEGRELLLSDTAGLAPEPASSHRREAALDEAMQEATTAELSRANLTLLCLDQSRSLDTWERRELATLSSRRLLVKTKCDLPAHPQWPKCDAAIATSSTTGAGILGLRAAILTALETGAQESGVIAPTAVRCRESLRLAAQALGRARLACRQSAGEELVAAELRLALEELGHVVGAVYTEDILDRVFSRFCIGK